MVVIRLARVGAKKRPFYHIVAKNKLSRRDGGCIERLGFFNPIAQGAEVRLQFDMPRTEYWLGVGAQTTDRVTSLLKEFKQHGVRTGKAYNDVKVHRKQAAPAAEQADTNA